MITRRDFLDGIAVSIGAALMPGCQRGDRAGELDYPPALTGMRGSHPGSFEVAHRLRDGTLALGDVADTGERYDLVVVGGGISGLAAAHYFRAARPGARVLILDNHDDVGGHAKRNEFTVDGHLLVSYGGTESIEYPSQYSAVAKQLLADIGVDLARFPAAFPPVSHNKLGLGTATFFDRETFGTDRLVRGSIYEPTAGLFAAAPISEAVRRDLKRLDDKVDYWPELTSAAKKARLAKLSYRNFLVDVAQLSPAALPWFQQWTHSLYGVGIDAVPALDCWALEFPGFAGLGLSTDEPSPGLGKTPQLEMHDEPSVQFVDGNATVARLLVRALAPGALPGRTMEDAVTARMDYSRLDTGPVRIRLSSTAVRVRPDGEVVYVRGDRAYRVHGDACVLACWHTIIPYLAPELPADQKKALAYAVKVPLVYTNVAVRNWRAFRELDAWSFHMPGGYFVSARLELHDRTQSPDEPAVVKLVRTPCSPGLPARDQHRLGRVDLLSTDFATFEANIRDVFARMLGEVDIAAITVNRWSHGYAYEYNSLWDDWAPGAEPCTVARRRFGRIAIANSDAGAYAYTDCAIDQARRAVDELGSDESYMYVPEREGNARDSGVP